MFSTDSTPYDLRFSIFGFPVRISWTFWLGALLLGGGDLNSFFVLAGVLLVSVLVHELGHAVAMRYFGRNASIVLHWMGGYAMEGGEGAWQDYSRGTYRRRTTGQQVIISLAGPAAGLLLGALVVLVVLLTGGKILVHLIGGFIPYPLALVNGTPALSLIANELLWFNIIISFMNLVPAWPLDGGQVARTLMVAKNPYQGLQNSLQLSMVASILMVAVGLLVLKSTFMAILFGSLAFGSYQELVGGGRRNPW